MAHQVRAACLVATVRASREPYLCPEATRLCIAHLSIFGMARTLAIDYGNKRVGLAVTDPLGMIATPLDTIHSKDLVAFVLAYHQREPLKAIVVGMPRTLLNEPTDSTSAVVGLLRRLRRELPELPVHEIDERFTSRMAKQAMLAGGLGRKARQDKATVDKVSATLILQSFLESPLSQ